MDPWMSAILSKILYHMWHIVQSKQFTFWKHAFNIGIYFLNESGRGGGGAGRETSQTHNNRSRHRSSTSSPTTWKRNVHPQATTGRILPSPTKLRKETNPRKTDETKYKSPRLRISRIELVSLVRESTPVDLLFTIFRVLWGSSTKSSAGFGWFLVGFQVLLASS